MVLALSARGALPEIGPDWLVVLAVAYPPILRLGMLRADPARMEAPVLMLWISIAAALAFGGEGGLALGWLTIVLGLAAAWDRKLDAGLLIVAAVASPLLAAVTRPDLLVALPGFLLLGVVSAVLLHAREAELRVRVQGTSALPTAGPSRRSSRVQTMRVAGGLVWVGVGLSGSLLLLSLLVLKGEMTVLERVETWREDARLQRDAPELRPRDRLLRGARSAPRDTRFSFGGDLTSSGDRKDGEDVRLLRVQLHNRAAGRTILDGRPFLLRASVVDRVTQAGFVAAEEEDPQRWPVDRSGLAILEESEGDLEIRCVGQDPIRFGRYRSILLAPEPRLAVRLGYEAVGPLAQVARPRPGVLALPFCPDTIDYSVISRMDRLDHAYVVGDRGRTRLRYKNAGHADFRYSELAARDHYGFDERAKSATAGAVDDLGKVLGVVDFLKNGFTYDRTVAFQGTWEDVQRLIDTGSGLCSHFAAAGLLMLRSQGIASRIATGFLVKDFDNDTRAYGVWESNAHAWIEVHFEDYGWVPFDVTPPSALEDLLSGTLSNTDSGSPELQAIAAGPRDVAAILGNVLAAVGLVFLSWPIALGLLLFLAGLVLATRWITRRTSQAPIGGAGLPRAERARYERLFLALEHLGFRRRRGQTPKELAAVVTGRGDSELAVLDHAVAWFYRSRFGGRHLTAEEASEVDRLIELLEARARDRRARAGFAAAP